MIPVAEIYLDNTDFWISFGLPIGLTNGRAVHLIERKCCNPGLYVNVLNFPGTEDDWIEESVDVEYCGRIDIRRN